MDHRPDSDRGLGLPVGTVYRLVQRGELPGEVVPASGPLGGVRRRYRLRWVDVDIFIEEARIRPGELAHLYPPVHHEPD